jgi:hypothetical protein
MVNACGKYVNSTWMHPWISRVLLCTLAVDRQVIDQFVRVKVRFFHLLFQTCPQQLSTRANALSPLVEHIFYPVSTATYNNCNQMKI